MGHDFVFPESTNDIINYHKLVVFSNSKFLEHALVCLFLVPLPARASVQDRNDAPAMRHAGALLRSRGFLVSTDLRQPGRPDPHSTPLLWSLLWFLSLFLVFGLVTFRSSFFFPGSCKILHRNKVVHTGGRKWEGGDSVLLSLGTAPAHAN